MNSHHHPRSPLVAAVAAFIILAATVVVARAIVIFAVAVTATVAIAIAIATTVVTLEGNLLLELVVVAAIWAHVPFWAAPKLIKCMAPPIEQRRALLLGLVALLAALLNTGTGWVAGFLWLLGASSERCPHARLLTDEAGGVVRHHLPRAHAVTNLNHDVVKDGRQRPPLHVLAGTRIACQNDLLVVNGEETLADSRAVRLGERAIPGIAWWPPISTGRYDKCPGCFLAIQVQRSL